MTEQQEAALTAGLKALAAASKDANVSRAVEEAVLAKMRALAPQAEASAHPARERWSPAGLAAAAALLVVSLSGAWLAHQVRIPSAPIQPKGFIALPGAAVLPPIESASIVRIVLPVSALPEYGLPITPHISDVAVDAELLIAQDGLPRAIRLVDESHVSRSTP